METTHKDVLKALIQAQIKKSFVPDYQSKATDSDGLGLMISKYFEWDGLEILKTLSTALEDANFHTENQVVRELIAKVEKDFSGEVR